MNNKDLIRQYVDTGLKLPQYQVEKLPNNLLQTYLRKRLIAFSQAEIDYDDYNEAYYIDDANEIGEYEYRLFNDENQKKYLDIFFGIPEEYEPEFNFTRYMSDDVKEYYLNKIAEVNGSIGPSFFNSLNDNLKLVYINGILNNDQSLHREYLSKLPDNLKAYYFDKRVRSGRELGSWEFDGLDDSERQRLVALRYKYMGQLSDKELDYATPDMIKGTILKNKELQMNTGQLKRLPEDLRYIYYKQKLENGLNIPYFEMEFIPKDLLLKHLISLGDKSLTHHHLLHIPKDVAIPYLENKKAKYGLNNDEQYVYLKKLGG